jgi:hypothetical protein
VRRTHLRDSWPPRATAWTAAVLAAGLLTGCGTRDASLQPGAARQLQARVLEVSEASSRNDPAAALQALQNLEADLASAQSKGQVSEERQQTITTIAAAVRADLNAAAAAKAAEEARIAQEAAAAQASQAATQTPAPAPEPAPEPAPADGDGDGDDKKGNGDKGKGKD